SFHALRADITGESPVFSEIGGTRIVSPALSRDASVIVFASTEDLTGANPDRNSEIFMLKSSVLSQLTDTRPLSPERRLEDGSFRPSITSDGRLVVFTSSGRVVLCEVENGGLSQLSEDEDASNAKISGDGSRVYYQRGSDLISIDMATRIRRTVKTGVSLESGRAVSNDGLRVVYSAETAPNESQVFLYDAREDAVRQLTQLGPRSVDVHLQPTISGDGKRVAFATRRRVTSASDGGVELYVYDLPAGQMQQVTNAPASATAEVVSSLNFDGSVVAFSFPRGLSGPV